MKQQTIDNEKMQNGIEAARLRGAQRKGYATIEDYEKARAVEQRKAVYIARIAQYEQEIKKMREYLANN